MFLLSKILSPLTQPLAWVALLFVLALWWIPRRPTAARRVMVAGLALGLIVGWQPLPDALLRRLETRFEPLAGSLQPFVGLLVLGGAIEPLHIWHHEHGNAVGSGSERVTISAALMREYPGMRLIYVGREASFEMGDGSFAPTAQLPFSKLGVDSTRVLHEQDSRNTSENALRSAALIGETRTLPWLLVTSARHMPRSLTAFRAAGWNVTPYPVDYLTRSSPSWTSYSLATGALHWQTVLHEYLGMLAYTLFGRV